VKVFSLRVRVFSAGALAAAAEAGWTALFARERAGRIRRSLIFHRGTAVENRAINNER
jgi:hypothetical protein